MNKKVAIVQSNYIPWKGYFDLINKVDDFVLYDEAQYTKRDWRNRNKIKTAKGTEWLTVPVDVKGKFHQKVNETQVSDHKWPKKHWNALKLNYSKAPYFATYKDRIAAQYEACESERQLSDINFRLIREINDILGIQTRIHWSSQFSLPEGKNERLIQMIRELGGTEYISGPSAQGYLDESLFEAENIKVSWMDYSGYPEYHQLFPPFEHGVTVLDLIFNEGPRAPEFMKSF